MHYLYQMDKWLILEIGQKNNYLIKEDLPDNLTYTNFK